MMVIKVTIMTRWWSGRCRDDDDDNEVDGGGGGGDDEDCSGDKFPKIGQGNKISLSILDFQGGHHGWIRSDKIILQRSVT